jgi:hypothetical protein
MRSISSAVRCKSFAQRVMRPAFAPARAGAFVLAKWDARSWIAGLMDVDEADLTTRSIDRYGETETQARYELAGDVVARLTVAGPVRPFLTQEGHGHWEIKAQIGSGSDDVHLLELPEVDEIVYE